MDDAISKYEFGSAGWLVTARDHVLKGLADSDLSDIEYSFCCIYTDPPAHLLDSNRDKIAWHVLIRNGQVVFGTHALERADFHLTADWAACQELARIVRKSLGGAERLDSLIKAGIASGKLSGTGLDQPGPDCFEALDLHDYLALRTL